ncbi:MAG: 2-oxo-4-hydroxy-4-carboxy-5-ureidoimidazoline decarboxylase [Gemmataceae bacterium]
MVDVAKLNRMSVVEARAAFNRCCDCQRWVEGMIARRPFESPDALFAAAAAEFQKLKQPDWLEAFAGHPKIGDMQSLKQKYGATSDLCSAEQAGAVGADEEVLQALAECNRAYETKFGHIFIVCASGKSAAEMLSILQSRLNNDASTELSIAAQEQAKITRLRLEKL